MNITAISPSRMSIKPSRRKIIRTVYAAEKFTKDIQKDLPREARGYAQTISEGCNKLRMQISRA